MNQKSNTSSNVQLLQWAAAGVGLFLAATAVYKQMNRYRLTNKVVVITGGSRGLGLEIARQLVTEGARLAICARTERQLEMARKELAGMGGEVIAIPADLTSRNAVKAMMKEVVQHFGRIDVLINNAGVIQVGPQEAMKIKDYEDAMDSNFWAPLYCMHAVIPGFIKQGEGRIVNITSIGGKVAVPHLLPYTASKFALVGLSEGMHAELKKYNIHVTTVVPNLMRTGSPRNVDVKGDHEREYAWFKISDSSPLLSQRVEVAARSIIHALEFGEAEAILSLSGKVATLLHGIAPAWVSGVLALANRFLPAMTSEGNVTRKGHQVESKRSRGPVAKLTDRAAIRNNEL